MIYVWAAIAVVVLFLVWQIIRWWNLPATIKEREKAAAARSERWRTRPRLFGRSDKKDVEHVVPKNPDDNLIEIEPKKPDVEPKEGLFARIRRKRMEKRHGR